MCSIPLSMVTRVTSADGRDGLSPVTRGIFGYFARMANASDAVLYPPTSIPTRSNAGATLVMMLPSNLPNGLTFGAV